MFNKKNVSRKELKELMKVLGISGWEEKDGSFDEFYYYGNFGIAGDPYASGILQQINMKLEALVEYQSLQFKKRDAGGWEVVQK